MKIDELVAALEAATGPDRELDAEIAELAGWELHGVPPWGALWFGPNGEEEKKPPAYSSSIDAALTLVPEGWFGRFEPRFYIDGEIVRYRGYCIRPKWARYTPMDDWFDAAESPDVHTPFSAICIAALKARSAQP